MKRITLFTGLVLFLLCGNKPASAQTRQGQVVINGGVGYSLMTAFIDPVVMHITLPNYYGPSLYPQYKKTEGLVYDGGVDYGLTSHFSLGLAAGYQTAVVYWTSWYNYETGQFENFDENISRLNIGLRILGHVVSSDNMDFYMGFRAGYSHWTDVNNSHDSAFIPSKRDLDFPSFQVLAGFRAYVASFLGFQIELAVGTPYFVQGGITLKFGGKKPENNQGMNTGKEENPNDPYAKERRAREQKNQQQK